VKMEPLIDLYSNSLLEHNKNKKREDLL